jgi:DNA-binding NarL/FixJ family response regulator
MERRHHHHHPRVLIADDHIFVAQGLQKLLEPEFNVVGLVHDGGSAVDAAIRLQPQVVILDISMPGLDGIDAGQQIKAFKPHIKLILLTMAQNYALAVDALRLGASGYVHKCEEAEEIRIAIRLALKGKSYLSPHLDKEEIIQRLRSCKNRTADESLSSRQSEILQLIVEGKRMQAIADILGLNYGTVVFHKYRMMERLGVKTSAGLIEYALRQRMVSKRS